MAGGVHPHDGLPGSIRDLDADARPLRDALEADFARLAHQLRRDVARELRLALREIFTDSQHTLTSSGVLRELASSRLAVAPEHHEWTRRHPRGFLAQELIQFFPDQPATPSQRAVLKSPRVPPPYVANQAPRDSSAGHALIARAETPNTLPEADTLDLTIKTGASSQAALVRDQLRQAAEESTTTEVVNLPADAEAEERQQPSDGEECGEEALRPHTMHGSEDNRPRSEKVPLPLGGQLVAHTPKATNLSPHRALGLVPSNTQFLTLQSQDPRSFHHKLSLLVCSPWFERVALSMNVASAAMVGYQTDHMARHIEEHHDLFLFRATDVVFLVFFTVEAALRLYVHKCRFFSISGWVWNVFDLLLVTFQFSEEVVRVFVSARGNDLWSSFLLRVVRVFRTIKLFRVMGRFDEFRLLVACILHSCKSFFWAVALLFLMNYVMATYLVQIICASMLSGDLAKKHWGSLTQWYGSLGSALYSILVGLTGGVDWNDIVDPIKVHISPYAASLFIVFMVFAILALMNVVTGTFVQNAIERADEVKQINKVQQARKLFKSLDVDSSGFIGFNELRNHLDSPEVQGYFRTIDVDLSEARCLFDMLDMNDSGNIDFQEFLSGCIRLQGHARSLDLLMVARDMRCSFDMVAKHFMTLEDNQRAIRSVLATLAHHDGGNASETLEPQVPQGKLGETV